ncbi:MAG: pyrroline-5-carboxylate reductase [Pseudomonadota bacterium]
MENKELKISVVGAGAMGSAIVRGLVNAALTEPRNLIVFDVDSEKSRSLKMEFGVHATESIEKAVPDENSVVVLAVKPQHMEDVLASLASSILTGTLVISIAAGISTEFILSKIGPDRRVIRAMPNAAAMVGQSSTAICPGGVADAGDLKTAKKLFESIGIVVEVDEKNLNAVTALSGSGPGYLFLIMEAMTDAGVLMGLSRFIARQLTVQTFLGAASMASHGKSFSDLKDLITSPGGTTISGLKIMELAGVRGIFMEAVENAALRAEKISGS